MTERRFFGPGRWRRRVAVLAPVPALVVAAGLTLATVSPSQAADVSKTFVPAADAYVRSDQPSVNFGAKYVLGAEAGSATTPTVTSYLTFTLSGLSGTVTGASLQLYSYATSSQGVTVSTAPSGWSESTITYDTAPPVGTAISSAALTLNTWATINVLPTVTGNGTVSLALTTTRTVNNQMASREATATPPKLIVTTSTDPSPSPSTTSPSPSPTASTSPSPTDSPSPTTTPTTTATSTTTTPPGATVSIVTAGDIACTAGKAVTSTSCQQQATSDVALSLQPAAVLPLGDDQYELGSLSDFQSVYDPTWGRMKSISYPVPGNHEYGYIGTAIEPTGGEGYFTYFGDRSHPLQPGCTINCTSWYSYDLGDWHLIALDSQCAVVGGCNPGNPQYTWLSNDLKANTKKCTLAYWHIPLFSSSQDHQPDMKSIYALLQSKGADVVLNGHAHFYERFDPQDSAGVANPNGLTEFLVGSGGRNFFTIRATPSANSVARIANTFGVLKMDLSSNGYSWQFVPTVAGAPTDSGSATCH
jgi:hypothetical protein